MLALEGDVEGGGKGSGESRDDGLGDGAHPEMMISPCEGALGRRKVGRVVTPTGASVKKVAAGDGIDGEAIKRFLMHVEPSELPDLSEGGGEGRRVWEGGGLIKA